MVIDSHIFAISQCSLSTAQKTREPSQNQTTQSRQTRKIETDLFMAALSISVGGEVGIGAHCKFENGMMESGEESVQTTMDHSKVCVLTRWPVRPGTEQVIFL